VVEWFKAAVLKTAVPGDRYRGFESHLLRHENQKAEVRKQKCIAV